MHFPHSFFLFVCLSISVSFCIISSTSVRSFYFICWSCFETGSKPVFFGVTKKEENDYEIADQWRHSLLQIPQRNKMDEGGREGGDQIE